MGTLSFEEQYEEKIWLLLQKYNIPGASIAIVENGIVVNTMDYSYGDKKTFDVITNNSIFQIASISKTVTAIGVLKLAEKKKIDLDEPIETYLTNDFLIQKKNKQCKITTRMLLNHSAGLSRVHYLGSACRSERDRALISLKEKPARVIYTPGEKSVYTGSDYTLLQQMIEDVTGMPFEEYMHYEIFLPLQMKHSFYDDTETDLKFVKGYNYFAKEIKYRHYNEAAAAGLSCSILDLGKIVSVICGHDVFLKKESLYQMKQKFDQQYGLGCFIDEIDDKDRIIWHSGKNQGFCSYFAFSEKKKSGIIILTNSDNGNHFITDLSSMWISHIYGKEPAFYQTTKIERSLLQGISFILTVVIILLFLTKLPNVFSNIHYLQSTGLHISKSKCLKHFLFPCIMIALWHIIFFDDRFCKRWALAPMLPYGFGKLSHILGSGLFLWSIISLFL